VRVIVSLNEPPSMSCAAGGMGTDVFDVSRGAKRSARVEIGHSTLRLAVEVDMTVTNSDLREAAADPMGRFWALRRVWPHLRPFVVGFLRISDPIARYRARRAARRLVTMSKWPDMAATSGDAAQLAMLRALDLQKKTRRAAKLWQGEAAAMLARSLVEALFLGLYCLRGPEAI
jgi:hypothetical protein